MIILELDSLACHMRGYVNEYHYKASEVNAEAGKNRKPKRVNTSKTLKGQSSTRKVKQKNKLSRWSRLNLESPIIDQEEIRKVEQDSAKLIETVENYMNRAFHDFSS